MSKPTKKKNKKVQKREVFTSPNARSRRLLIKVPLIGFHCWPEAPDHLSYLRAAHRHVFNITVAIVVDGDDRTIEFHEFADKLSMLADTAWSLRSPLNAVPWSCEEIANRLYEDITKDAATFKLGTSVIVSITVQEDNEHAAEVFFSPQKLNV